jgi:hypothetical protein
MPRVGFEHMIPASKRAKTVYALDHSATVTGNQHSKDNENAFAMHQEVNYGGEI